MARARLVHEGAVLTGPHGGRGGVRGAPDGAVLLEARKLHSDRACRAGRKETAVTRAPPSSAWQEERGLSRQLLWARAAAAQEALSWGPCLHPEPREMKLPSAEREAASCPLAAGGPLVAPPRAIRPRVRTSGSFPAVKAPAHDSVRMCSHLLGKHLGVGLLGGVLGLAGHAGLPAAGRCPVNARRTRLMCISLTADRVDHYCIFLCDV